MAGSTGSPTLVQLTNPMVQLAFTGGITPKGAYAAGTEYHLGDSISYNGSSYVAVQTTTGNVPTDATYWQVLSVAGGAGAQGAQGVQGEIGPGVHWQGDWETDIAYTVEDVVRYATTQDIYFCVTAHTSDVFATDLAAGKWSLAINMVDAKAAKDAAEAAQAAAEHAQADAETAQGLAEDAKDGADADVILTHADVVLTHADVVTTGQDKIATAADRVQTGLDRVATGQDKIATAADRVQTGLDRVATGDSAGDALVSEGKAQEWAINPEGDPVETGPDQYSALHWAAKAEEWASTIDPTLYVARLKGLFTGAVELALSSDAITVTQTLHLVDTQADDPMDNLSTINGGVDGQLLAIRAAHEDRTVIIKHNTGNILTDGSDISLGDTTKYVLFLYDGALSKWIVVGGGGSGGGLAKAIHQVAHGFAVGNVVYLNSGVYTKAIANTVAAAEAVGIVSVVAGNDDFTLSGGGYIPGLSGLTAGTVYFLSDVTAGAITATEPVTEGSVSKPIFTADSTTSGYFFNMRGAVVGGGATTFVTTFTNADLAAGILTVTHNFGHQYCGMPTIIDNNGKVVLQDETTYSSTTALAVSLISQGAITGTWRVIVNDSGASAAADAVSDTPYGAGWTGTGVAPSQNAMYDELEARKDGWIPVAGAWTYASANTINVPSGAALLYGKGDKLRLKQGGAYKYFYIITVADALLTVTGGSDFTVATPTAITDIYYSHIENPIGFPDWFNYVPVASGTTGSLGAYTQSQAVGKFKINGLALTVLASLQVTNWGSWSGNVMFLLPAGAATTPPGAHGVIIANAAVAIKAITLGGNAGDPTRIAFTSGLFNSAYTTFTANDCFLINGVFILA